jgi:FdhD protein
MSQDEPAGARPAPVQRLAGGAVSASEEWVVVERPLRIVVQWMPLLTTMRTPGDERELVVGYLVNEGVIREATQVASFALVPGARVDTARIELAHFEERALAGLRRAGVSVSSCGVCGRDEEQVFEPRAGWPAQGLAVPLDALEGMLDAVRGRQRLFGLTGGLHAAGVFAHTSEPLCVYEDLGRHNAIDKAVGWLLREGWLGRAPLALVSSGRASFEVVQKAAMAGIGTVISVSAASSMAIEVARTAGITLVGFVRPGRAVIYTHAGG